MKSLVSYRKYDTAIFLHVISESLKQTHKSQQLVSRIRFGSATSCAQCAQHYFYAVLSRNTKCLLGINWDEQTLSVSGQLDRSVE